MVEGLVSKSKILFGTTTFNTLPVHVTFVAHKSSEGQEGKCSLFSSLLFEGL
jgi:hypothetical protein